jgi:hypothetical protein
MPSGSARLAASELGSRGEGLEALGVRVLQALDVRIAVAELEPVRNGAQHDDERQERMRGDAVAPVEDAVTVLRDEHIAVVKVVELDRLQNAERRQIATQPAGSGRDRLAELAADTSREVGDALDPEVRHALRDHRVEQRRRREL